MSEYLSICERASTVLLRAPDNELLGNLTVHLHFAGSLSHLPTLGNNNIRGRPLASQSCVFNFSHDIHPIDNLAEDDVFVFEERGRNGSDKELRTVGIRPGILCS